MDGESESRMRNAGLAWCIPGVLPMDIWMGQGRIRTDPPPQNPPQIPGSALFFSTAKSRTTLVRPRNVYTLRILGPSELGGFDPAERRGLDPNQTFTELRVLDS